MTAHNRLAVNLVCGTTQTLWLRIELLSPVLGDRIAGRPRMSSTSFFAALSASLVVSAVVGPRAGGTAGAIAGSDLDGALTYLGDL
jgi:hypothetical protein